MRPKKKIRRIENSMSISGASCETIKTIIIISHFQIIYHVIYVFVCTHERVQCAIAFFTIFTVIQLPYGEWPVPTSPRIHFIFGNSLGIVRYNRNGKCQLFIYWYDSIDCNELQWPSHDAKILFGLYCHRRSQTFMQSGIFCSANVQLNTIKCHAAIAYMVLIGWIRLRRVMWSRQKSIHLLIVSRRKKSFHPTPYVLTTFWSNSTRARAQKMQIVLIEKLGVTNAEWQESKLKFVNLFTMHKG